MYQFIYTMRVLKDSEIEAVFAKTNEEWMKR